jgi:CRP-like cAMP-binding protein
MAGHNKSSKFEPGQVILRENTPGDSAYIILSGQVEISKVIEGQRVVLDRLGPGSIFGEMSLLTEGPDQPR